MASKYTSDASRNFFESLARITDSISERGEIDAKDMVTCVTNIEPMFDSKNFRK